MRIHRLWALVAVGSLACGSDAPPGARIAAQRTLADSPLMRMQNVSLIAAGDGFTMAGFEGGQVRWARVSPSGDVTLETGFAMAAPAIGPYFAMTSKAAAADQLIALGLYPSTTVSGGYDLLAVVQDLGAGQDVIASPKVLASLPTGTDLTKVRLTAGSAKSGSRAFVAWGTQVQKIKVQYLLLGANATPTGDAGSSFGDRTDRDPPPWDCLMPSNNASGLGFGIIGTDLTDSKYTDYVTADMDDSGAMSGEMTYGFDSGGGVTNCGLFGAPGPNGTYLMAFDDEPGIGAAFYYPPAPGATNGTLMPYKVLISANTFGDPSHTPHVAWVSPAGNDILIGLARTAGPYVVRYTYQAVPHGSALLLPSALGKTGPVSASVGSDHTYVTYTDAASTGTVRYLVSVDPA
jgi:hypothetical protein